MKAIVLYSQHEAGQQAQAQALAAHLGAYAIAVDVLEVYGSQLGGVMLDLLAVREFPAVVFIQDHLAGAGITDTGYLVAVAAEQHDIEAREFRRTMPGHLQARLEGERARSREEVRQLVREADRDGTISGKARQKLQAASILE